MDIFVFYYVLLSMGVIGFTASSYLARHTGRRTWERKASIFLEVLFIGVMAFSVLGIGGDISGPPGKELALWMLLPVILYTGSKAIDLWFHRLERELRICKEKKYRKLMRKEYGT